MSGLVIGSTWKLVPNNVEGILLRNYSLKYPQCPSTFMAKMKTFWLLLNPSTHLVQLCHYISMLAPPRIVQSRGVHNGNLSLVRLFFGFDYPGNTEYLTKWLSFSINWTLLWLFIMEIWVQFDYYSVSIILEILNIWPNDYHFR